MNPSQSVKTQSILVIGAGELGMPVLRNLARKAKDREGATISVLLREATAESMDPVKKQNVSEIRELGIEIVPGDILAASISELAAIFARYDTVIGCAGFSAGRNTPMKMAKAALEANLERYFPWQFGVDFDVIGRGSPQDLKNRGQCAKSNDFSAKFMVSDYAAVDFGNDQPSLGPLSASG